MPARVLRSSRGFTLAEVSIAALLLAIGATGIFAVVLTCRYNVKNNQAREETQHYARKLVEDLKGYVRESNEANATNAPNGTWAHPNDSSANAAWALAAGAHTASTVLPQYLRDPPFNATLSYTVTLLPCANPSANDCPRQIDVTVRWDEAE